MISRNLFSDILEGLYIENGYELRRLVSYGQGIGKFFSKFWRGFEECEFF
jgi:hypothetical protein